MARFLTRAVGTMVVASLLSLAQGHLWPSLSARADGAPSAGSTPRGCSEQSFPHLASSFVSGTLLCVSAQRLIIMVAGTAVATVVAPMGAHTQVCRAAHGCQATWRDLQPGDVVDVGMADGAAGQQVAQWVDANMVTGYGTIRARTVHSLTLALAPRGGRAGYIRVLFLAPVTVVTTERRTSVGSTDGLRVGQNVYFTASAESAHLLTAPLWAIHIFVVFMRPSAGEPLSHPSITFPCTESLRTGVRCHLAGHGFYPAEHVQIIFHISVGVGPITANHWRTIMHYRTAMTDRSGSFVSPQVQVALDPHNESFEVTVLVVGARGDRATAGIAGAP